MIWENDNTKGKINSVKQEYDETKRKYYLKQIEYVDRKLAGLYQYIENNYEENEIVITLFADHGQGFLVRPEEEFLCDERTKIAFMTKGGGVLCFRCTKFFGKFFRIFARISYCMCTLNRRNDSF